MCVNLNGTHEETDLVFSNDEWHTVGITFGDYSRVYTSKQSVKVFLDGEEYLLTNLIEEPYGILELMVGRSFDEVSYPLYGHIEMLAVRPSDCSLAQMNPLCEDLKGVSKITIFDELGMLRKAEVHKAGTPIVSNIYSYKKTLSNLLTKPPKSNLFCFLCCFFILTSS